MSIKQLAREMRDVKLELDATKEKSTELQNRWDELRKIKLPDALEDAGIESVRLEGIGTVSLHADAYCTVKAGMGDELQKWLIKGGHGDIIKETVNSSTLKAFLKELVKKGDELPEEFVNFKPYEFASITKS